ncbi:beta-L-arabinofuranosidase domain-containing protein [Fulvivirga ligni]|uniref:beta-L-arabinofuranosidase domain-containing protein n=1 Tax=Fulvivirga ligni TaxID=2904246 RepID=UPI001F454EDC|nr:beta-L-arabinofuranosidase domain-containing protein [Fulvivirga ligni]UII21455.1 glycoside hydrolase family 127 protein [Fulvivirga ligni]
MYSSLTLTLLFFLTLGLSPIGDREKDDAQPKSEANYLTNRSPLISSPYLELPLGAIKPHGWLKDQLVKQKQGMTGHLDEQYPLVMGKRNGWLGGDGDQWERGPYWIDGLLPLAYILDDEELKAKVKPWIEWSLNNQREDGYFGPIPPKQAYGHEDGIQRDNIEDWWPKMVMLKVLQQYYSATQDQRVIQLMTKYFKYQLKELPNTPLGHWTFWANRRGGDNLQVIYWLYNITGDKFLLDLAEIVHEQTFNWTDVFLNQEHLRTKGSLHCVNIAQGIKEPIIYYQQAKDSTYIRAVEKGFYDLMKFNGQPHGLYGGDEWLHGSDPTQGSEFCSAVEMMFSLESMLKITGMLDFAERLERVAFNALPTQANDDYTARQYFQQSNQIEASRKLRNFVQQNGGNTLCFGLLTGYPCCTSNMHQGWPKFVQNLWYATPEGGLAALVYAPSEVTAKVADCVEVNFIEETNYPFEESVKFTLQRASKKKVTFDFDLRIPEWCSQAKVLVNGQEYATSKGGKIVTVSREWKKGDQVTLEFPMHIETERWHERALSVKRGPLVYALKVEEEWKKVENKKDPQWYGDFYYEVYAKSPWNYGLLRQDHLVSTMTFSAKQVNGYPWNLENAPLEIKATAKRVSRWQEYNGMAGPIPYSPNWEPNQEVEEITLIPYGCTTMRISEFPEVW